MAISLGDMKKKKTESKVEDSKDIELETNIESETNIEDIDKKEKKKLFENSKRANNMRNFASEYKKNLILLGVVTCVGLSLSIISGGVKKVVESEKGDQENIYAELTNEIRDIENDPEYKRAAEIGDTIEYQDTPNKNITINWLGDKVDTGRWMTDESYFWTWIEPAFTYNSAIKYNEMKDNYYNVLGPCYFTTSFLAPYDHTMDMKYDANNDGELSGVEAEAANIAFTCDTNKSKFMTFPIGELADGSYEYLALVPMRSKGSKNYIMIAFTYAVIHSETSDGKENVVIDDFNCWAPDSDRLYIVQ